MVADVNNNVGVIRPDYYKNGGLQPIEIIRAWGLGFNLGSVVKYIGRPGKTGTISGRIEDLKKAITYLQFEIEDLEKAKATDITNPLL